MSGHTSIQIDPFETVGEREAARLIGVSYTQIRRLRTAGTGPAYLQASGTRGAVRYRKIALLRYLEELEARASKGAA